MTRLYQPFSGWVVWEERPLFLRGIRVTMDCAICGDRITARVHRHQAVETKKKLIRAFHEVHRHPEQRDPATWAKRHLHPGWTPEAERQFVPRLRPVPPRRPDSTVVDK